MRVRVRVTVTVQLLLHSRLGLRALSETVRARRGMSRSLSIGAEGRAGVACTPMLERVEGGCCRGSRIGVRALRV